MWVPKLKLDLTVKELNALNSFIVEYIYENKTAEFENDLKDVFEKIIRLHIQGA